MTEKRIPFYRDKRADTLTRDELLEAYTHACDALERQRQWYAQVQEMNHLFVETARALARERDPR